MVFHGASDVSAVLMSVWPQKDSFDPEGITQRPSDGLLWIFSDDGTLEVPVDSPGECVEGELLKNNICPNKYLTDPARKTFRIRKHSPVNADK